MTALDQAFIRAYLQQGAAPPAVEDLGVPGFAVRGKPEPAGEPADELPAEPPAELPADAEMVTDVEPPAEPIPAEEVPGPSGQEPFRPSFQVDGFAWPSGCTRLSTAAEDQLDHLADGLTAGLSEGRKVVGLGSCRQGEGCTTLLLCAARRLAERGLTVAMVDADFDHPELAGRLGLLPESGWEEVLAGRLPLAEAVVESVQDRIVLLPWLGPVSSEGCPTADPAARGATLNALREHYDLVLIDLGAFDAGSPAVRVDGRWIDAVVLVHDVRSTPQAELNRARARLEAAGIDALSVAENFVK